MSARKACAAGTMRLACSQKRSMKRSSRGISSRKARANTFGFLELLMRRDICESGPSASEHGSCSARASMHYESGLRSSKASDDLGKFPLLDQISGLGRLKPGCRALALLGPVIELSFDAQQVNTHLAQE